MNRDHTALRAPASFGGAFLVGETPPEAVLTPERLDIEVRLMADAAADFMRGEVLPVADRLEAHEADLMPTLLRRAAALGLLSIDVPPEYGGLGLAKSVSARIAEALAAEPSFAVSHNVHTSVATLPIVFFGSPAQKATYLPRLASGEWIGAYALSESHAGSDALAARARATLSADRRTYHLSGEKMWITNAAFADLFTVFAKVDGEKFTAFLVERRMPGVSIGREEHKLGLKGSSTCRLLLDDVRVPVENVLGGVGQGGRVALYTLNLGRFKIAATSVGQGKNLLGIATRYAMQRYAFGRPIAEFGLIRQKLATMAARLFAAESILYRVAGALDNVFADIDAAADDAPIRYAAAAEEYAVECALLKVTCTETLDFCADECLQIHGGYGYTEEFPAARAWRDARINRIYEGTNEINRLNVVQLLRKRIEKGRLVLPEAGSLASTPGSEQSVSIAQARAAALHTWRERMAACEPLFAKGSEAQEMNGALQEVNGALADMMIALFTWESVDLRVRQMQDAADGSATRFKPAQLAERVIAAESRGRLRENALAILEVCCGSDRPVWEQVARLFEGTHRSLTSYDVLAQVVVEAEGYPW